MEFFSSFTHSTAKEHHEQVYGEKEHKGHLSHELIAGAAAFEAVKAYEKKREAEGHHDHALARELLAAFAAAETEKLFETKGLTYLDREKAKRDAEKAAKKLYSDKYESDE